MSFSISRLCLNHRLDLCRLYPAWSALCLLEDQVEPVLDLAEKGFCELRASASPVLGVTPQLRASSHEEDEEGQQDAQKSISLNMLSICTHLANVLGLEVANGLGVERVYDHRPELEN